MKRIKKLWHKYWIWHHNEERLHHFNLRDRHAHKLKELNKPTALDVAQYFLSKSRNKKKSWSITDSVRTNQCELTNTKLQQLLFLSQGWNLAINNSGLFCDDVEAWIWGACVPEVFYKYRCHAWEELPQYRGEIPEEVTDMDKEILDAVWNSYEHISGRHLANIVIAEIPWKNASIKERKTISADDMKDYYREFLDSKLTK